MNNVIYDANNHVRRIVERDNTGTPLRSIYMDVISRVARKDNVFFIWDGFKANQRRRDIFPGYKVGRQKPSESIYEAFKMLEELLAYAPVIQCKMDSYEADDVIANLALHFARKGETVEIHSTDYDFMQLSGMYPKNIFVGAKPKENVPIDLVPYYKVTVGDSSDKIPGIPGFGELTWKQIGGTKVAEWVNEIVFHNNDDAVLEGMPKRCKPDPSDIRKYWAIVGFFELSVEEIAENFKIGKADYIGGNDFLKRYMQ